MKRKVLVVFLIFITLILVGVLVNRRDNDHVLAQNTRDDILKDLLVYDFYSDLIDKDFLNWVASKYGDDVLYKINDKLKSNTYSLSSWHEVTGYSLLVLTELYNDIYSSQDNVKIIEGNKDKVTIGFVGDVSLADNWEIMPYYDSRGSNIYGILSSPVVDIMNSADLMIANNEFTISDRGEKMPNKIYTFRASPKRVSIYNEMGVDLVTLANNHVYDFGYDAFMDTLTTLKEYNMPYIGAGRNISEAIKPYYFIINGYKIGFVNATRAEKYILTPEATESSPGVFRTYDPTLFMETIKKTKENSDFVVALIHWGKEDSHYLEDVQKETSKLYIDSGADVIVGTHAHVLQGIEFYNNKPIVYNIGDFIFNRESKETGIFNIILSNDGKLEYSFIPCKQDNFKTSLLYDEEREKVLKNMEEWSVNATFDENGYIKES